MIAQILRRCQVGHVFAYPGTSELALCDTLIGVKNICLINGRGDKESAFMAAGGSLYNPCKTVALLHGARGLTNAAGAIADAYRNELQTVFFVGLPSTTSARFLPPHGEKNLMSSVGNFTKSFHVVTEAPNSTDTPRQRRMKVHQFLMTVVDALLDVRRPPFGPTLCGIPQDCLEQKWITSKDVTDILRTRDLHPRSHRGGVGIEKMMRILEESDKPLILVDDFLFHYHEAHSALKKFAHAVCAPIVQIHYKRGPMFFERIDSRYNPYFIGQYNVNLKAHQHIMKDTDVLVTLEDRNAYQRVVGVLPTCCKIAITTNAGMTKKNEYLRDDDVLVETDDIIALLISAAQRLRLRVRRNHLQIKKQCTVLRAAAHIPTRIDAKYTFVRKTLPSVIAQVLSHNRSSYIIDDSQMFGGLLAEQYELFQRKTRVFGDHGAFVGAGISYANGFALCNPKATVLCTLGDQAFTNGLQGLVAAVENNISITYIVCNNQQSVSLLKQAHFQHFVRLRKSAFLLNAPISYSKIASAIGIRSTLFTVPVVSNKRQCNMKEKELYAILGKAINYKGPALIELIMPSEQDAWSGIWATSGNETKTRSKKNQ